MKQCTKCLEFKLISSFYKQSKNSKDGYQSHCKPCDRNRKKGWEEKNKDLVKAYQAKSEENRKNSQSRKDWKKDYRKQPHVRACLNASYAKRRAAKIQRTPKWLTEQDLKVIKGFYSIAQMLSKVNNEEWHVDHKIPLQGKMVSGLHVPSNLQLMRGIDNETKRNEYCVN